MMFDWNSIALADIELMEDYLGPAGGYPRQPDLTIAPDGVPYLYRWHLTRRNKKANVYLHVQVASDPERPLHDHPWDNQSVILRGGYKEIIATRIDPDGRPMRVERFDRQVGDVIPRVASQPHRLLLPDYYKYTITLFSTGPKVREWGFWYPTGWKSADDVTRLIDGQSVHVKEPL